MSGLRWIFASPRYRQVVLLQILAREPRLWWSVHQIENVLEVNSSVFSMDIEQLRGGELVEMAWRVFPNHGNNLLSYKITVDGLRFLRTIQASSS